MWQIVKSNNLKTKGLDVWVYEPIEIVFTGVALREQLTEDVGLQPKVISLQSMRASSTLALIASLKFRDSLCVMN